MFYFFENWVNLKLQKSGTVCIPSIRSPFRNEHSYTLKTYRHVKSQCFTLEPFTVTASNNNKRTTLLIFQQDADK